MLLVNFFKETNMSPNNHNSHSHNDQESNKFVNSNRTFYNSVQKFIKKVKNTFKNQETYKIDNHIDAMKSSKKSNAVDSQDTAFNFLKDVWIFFCKAASFIIKASRTLFDIVKPHAIKAFNKTKTFFKKAHKVLIQNENGMLHFNKENQKESFCRIIGILSATLSLALTGALVYNFAKTYIANSKATYYWDQASYFTEASVACVILISLLLVITGIFLFTANQAKKENKVDVNININTSDEGRKSEQTCWIIIQPQRRYHYHRCYVLN